MPEPDLEALLDEEYEAYVRYNQAVRGDDGLTKHSPVSPKRVREKRATWHAAVAAIEKAGYTADDVRAYLREKGDSSAT